MLPMTSMVDDRINDRHTTAAELRHERSVARADRIGWTTGLRLWLGTTLLKVGTALVSGARPVASTSAGR